MNRVKYIIIFLTALNLSACGQTTTKEQNPKSEFNNNKMDTNKLTNSTVKQAFDAWQKGDSKTFLAFFTADAKLFDDGSSRDFQKFVKDACGHEKFTSIDKVENKGLDITGNFHTESWGDFKTYFNFTINEDGKFSRLDIGQAK